MSRLLLFLLLLPAYCFAQMHWRNVDSVYQPLPPSLHVYYSDDSLDGKPNRAYYVEASLNDRSLVFASDTTSARRLTPSGFYQKNAHPLVVVNCTFFEFVNNSNLNLVVNRGKMLATNAAAAGKGKDTLTYQHTFVSALGIQKNRKADIGWTITAPGKKWPYISQKVQSPFRDSAFWVSAKKITRGLGNNTKGTGLNKWKVQTAIGGGPVLLQNGEVRITNNEEMKFAGKAINDKHPRTGIGYTPDGKLIIMVIEGRSPGKAEGATLLQAAGMFKQLGCVEAMNLDGGGSSCMLVNGRPTITPSDKEGQRPVPAVFMIKER